MLLLMGMYTIIIPTVKETLKSPESGNLLMLGVFGTLDALLVPGYLFPRFVLDIQKLSQPDPTTLTGFMLGSLNKIWYWRKAVLGLTESGTS
ncbi:MAG: DUF368 domain-containing protein [Lewinellaceae bacterium]|nr:DUF368 domain-containing protein [Lewinellaceae bacterium]